MNGISPTVGAYVLVLADAASAGRRALVECEGDAASTWDVRFDDDGTEAEAVPETRLSLDPNQVPSAPAGAPPVADAALLAALSAGTDPRFARPPSWRLPNTLTNPDEAWARMKVQRGRRVTPLRPVDPRTPQPPGTLRVVCISDTHGHHDGSVEIPAGDVLVHAGDFTGTGERAQVKAFAKLIAAQPHKRKVVIAGNHDLTFEPDTYPRTRRTIGYHTTDQDCAECIRTVKDVCTYLEDSEVTIAGVKFYGSPWSPTFFDWAFNADRGKAIDVIWQRIPDDVDVLITHGPPVGHGDLCSGGNRAGCVDLLRHVETRIQPKLHVFGHIHEACGVTTNGQTCFVNASTCTLQYRPTNPAFVFDIPLPSDE